ncbi:MAG: NUDIX hydrolase [Candidatus Pseudoscilispira sp.]|nr:NUDIX hydrolase [bacterium 210917-SL.2.15]MDY4036871.1 NUDIX hydrolase [Candidatus Pseudoscilispira sp.]
MELTETKLSGRTVYHGRIVDIHMDEVRLPNGKTSQREVVEHPGGVVILPLDERMQIITVTQYRYAMGTAMTELPAGKLERGERSDPASAALRELHEEIGAVPGSFVPLGVLHSSPGIFTETLYLYLARDLTFVAPEPDEDEFLRIERVPFDTMVQRIMDGEITDAKTVAAVLKAKVRLHL